MSFMYPDVIAISRIDARPTKGVQSYRGLQPESLLISGVAANIQLTSSTSRLPANLPGDVSRGTLWEIYFRNPKLRVKDRDIITDQNGIRYQVMGSFPHRLGYTNICERLQT